MRKLLPQANNLDTLIQVFIYYGNKLDCTIQNISEFIGFEPRQAQYYLSACIYLDLIDGDARITHFGKTLLEEPATIRFKIYERIIIDEVIGKIFAHYLLFDDNLTNFSCRIIRDYYPDYSDAVILRRASTIRNWCERIAKDMGL